MGKDNIIIEVPTLHIKLTPYAQAVFASDVSAALKSIDTSTRFSAAKVFLICLSIELAMKSALLDKNIEKHGHEIGNLLDLFKAEVKNNLLTPREEMIIKQVESFYYYDKETKSSKGIVYFEANMKKQFLSGYKDIPDISSLQIVLDKFIKYLEENKHFIDANLDHRAQ